MKIYIDGACAVHTGKNGAWAYVVVDEDKVVHEDSGFETGTTNARMELRSAIESLHWLWKTTPSGEFEAEIFSDSSYLVNGVNNWKQSWIDNGWVTVAGEPVKNKDQWFVIYNLIRMAMIRFTWVKGHSGEKWNEYVDGLCKLVAEQTPIRELKLEENCYTTNG